MDRLYSGINVTMVFSFVEWQWQQHLTGLLAGELFMQTK
jgi:hypothetical protein